MVTRLSLEQETLGSIPSSAAEQTQFVKMRGQGSARSAGYQHRSTNLAILS